MTEIAFHFNVPDRVGYACRLLRKATGSGAKVVLIAPVDELAQLDLALWTFSATEFVPHCVLEVGGSLLSKSAVVLTSSLKDSPVLDVLVNLSPVVPPGFDQFKRVIEVVTVDDVDRKQSRQRWKYYADAGYGITRHDIQRIMS